MNSKELIVGHFEGTLSPADQGALDRMLDSSPEIRAEFERQQMIEDGLAEDSRSLIPPVGLREATLAAALGSAVSTIGGGISAWFTAKVAAVVGTVAVGGLVVGGLLINDGEEPQGTSENVPPVVQVEQEQDEPEEVAPVVAVEENDRTEEPTVATRPAPATRIEHTTSNGGAEADADNDGDNVSAASKDNDDPERVDFNVDGIETPVPSEPKVTTSEE